MVSIRIRMLRTARPQHSVLGSKTAVVMAVVSSASTGATAHVLGQRVMRFNKYVVLGGLSMVCVRVLTSPLTVLLRRCLYMQFGHDWSGESQFEACF